jgi:polyisoprenyl-teichoic acid--peptidoglycan teichoic acid transferase
MVEPVFSKPPPSGDHEPAPKPKRYWWRFGLGSLVIVLAVAGATAASILLYVDSIATALSHHNVYKDKLNRYLSQVNGGEPENILILGSDKRANLEEDPGRSDTTILLRLDPDRNAIAVMSIPRDLKVEIPGFGTEKFNAAYTYGGPRLTLRVVKELTGLPINHVVNVDFLGFVRAVDAIGCVYTDVDRRYYHSNVGLPPSEQYSEINIKPGYQLLCGKKALQYVRYRHTDTDLVRSARQQDFISSARERVPISKLVLGQNDLIDIFTKYTTSDISDAETMLQVLKLFIASRNAAIKEVHFPAELGPSYVYASSEAIHEAVDKFLGIEASAGPRGSLDEGRSETSKGKHAKHRHPQKEKPHLERLKPPGSDGLLPAHEAGEAEAKTVARKVSAGFPVFYPTRLPPGAFYMESNSYEHIQDPRVYHLKDSDEERHGAYRMVIDLPLSDGTHYIGVQGLQGWSDPPTLDNASLTKTIHGREYEIFVDGDRVSMVAWHRGDNTYWVSNDLLNTLTNDQMVGMARSAKVIIPNPKPRKGRAKR